MKEEKKENNNNVIWKKEKNNNLIGKKKRRKKKRWAKWLSLLIDQNLVREKKLCNSTEENNLYAIQSNSDE